MVILIAEAKTMESCRAEVAAALRRAHTPEGEAEADAVMARVQEMDVAELMQRVGISARLAAGLKEMAYEFPNKHLGAQALDAYTGVVFKALDAASLDTTDRKYAAENVCVLSSLYGLLRSDDIIKPYRLDYGARLAPDGGTMAAWLRPTVTDALLRLLRERGERHVLNLLPADTARMLDMRRLDAEAEITGVSFIDASTGRTPSSTRLKTLRGHLLRTIIRSRITDPADLRTLTTDLLLPSEVADPAKICFIT